MPAMLLLLVDDRDGRVVAEIETEEEVERVLSAWATGDGTIPAYLSLVQLHSHHGAIVGTDTSVSVHPL